MYYSFLSQFGYLCYPDNPNTDHILFPLNRLHQGFSGEHIVLYHASQHLQVQSFKFHTFQIVFQMQEYPFLTSDVSVSYRSRNTLFPDIPYMEYPDP